MTSNDEPTSFSYALLRAVPSLERGESINLGVVLFCPGRAFLAMKTGIDPERLEAFAPGLDPGPIAGRLEEISALVDGDDLAGEGVLPQAERFRMVVAESRSVVRPSRVHSGLTSDPAAELSSLFERLVRQPATST
jgi:hypothetical protein